MNDNQDNPHKSLLESGRVTGQPATEPAPAAPSPVPEIEDAGSRALSDALRSSFIIVKILMAGLVILFFASGVFTVPSHQRAIVLRFGKPVGTGEQQLLGPGLHWSFPEPIDEVVRIPTGEIQKVRSTAGWYATTPEAEESKSEPEAGPSLNPATDGYTITADGNIIHVRVDLRYRISEPLKYVLNFEQASKMVQNALDSALFYVSAQYKVDQALRDDRLGFQDKIVARVRDLVREYDLGVTIEAAEMIQTIPPRYVGKSFEQVSIAELERRQAREKAEAYAGTILSTAQGEANSLINRGKSDANSMLQSVQADAQYFAGQLAHYQANPGLFRARLQAETMTRVLTNLQEKPFYVPPRAGAAGQELRLLLNRDLRRSNTNQTDQAQQP